MGDASPEKSSGCGLLNAVFGRRPKKPTSASSVPTANASASTNSKRRRGTSAEPAFQETGLEQQPPPPPITSQKPGEKPAGKASQNHPKTTNPHHHQPHQPKKAPDNAATNKGYGQGRKVPYAATGISGELDSMITDHQRSKGSSTLVRASSSNVMLFGSLGNLRQPGAAGNSNVNPNPNPNPNLNSNPNGKYPTSVMGNVVKKPSEDSQNPTSLCRALSTRMDPETLKIMGNEDYKNGRFEDALALYDAAISIDPNKASYRSNKSAALTALGRLLEAVFECKEAIRIDPHYQRAHNRLATLYLRLGEAGKALYHYKHAGAEADPDVITKAKNVQFHLNRCTEAKKLRDWNSLLKESTLAISAGADSAPLIYALKAEAMLKLQRHQEADETLTKGPNFDADECGKFFGPIGNASLLVIRAQVDMAAGRFDDAMAAAQKAARLDANNKEASMVVRKTRVIATARSKGNELFKASRFSEACVAYEEGLDHDSYNSVLLCNRAACRSKLGHFDKAIDDCNAALNVRPSYAKARLRRADCYAKLGRWEACVQDYEALLRNAPDDEEVAKGLKEAQEQLNKQGTKDSKVGDAAHDDDLVAISNDQSF